MLLPNATPRSLWSSESGLLTIPQYRLSFMGSRSFSGVALKLWNSLPRSLGLVNNPSEFKSKIQKLKTSQNVTFVKLTSVSSVLSAYYSSGVRFISCICLMLSSVLLFDVILCIIGGCYPLYYCLMLSSILLFDVIITYWMFIVKCP